MGIVGDEKAIFGVDFGVVVCTVGYEGFGKVGHGCQSHYLVVEILVRTKIPRKSK